MNMAGSPVGERVRRLEDPELVRGAGHYVEDLPLPGVLSVVFVRCPFGHARVRRLSLDRARQMPGVIAAFGPKDLAILGKPMPRMNYDPGIQERQPSPLTEEARCAGEAVAVVLAEDPYRAVDAAAAVDVDYEELPTVMDPFQALKSGSPLVHSDVPGNVVGRLQFSKGDINAAFQHADITLREQFHTDRVYNGSLETRAVAAQPGGTEGATLTVWSSTQASHPVWRSICEALGLARNQVHVITPLVGGGFGSKGRTYPEEIGVAALAMHLGRPCRWVPSRSEDFQTAYLGHGSSFEAELAARSDGTILGLRAHLTQDAGAYLIASLIVPLFAEQHILGPYNVPAADVEGVVAYTNKSQLTPIRGGGREQGVFVIERMLDHLARRVGIDPLQVRQRNILQPDEFPYNTHYPTRYGGEIVYDSGDYPGYLKQARELIGYDEIKRVQTSERAQGKYRGVGLTLYVESTAMGKEGARVEVKDDGSVELAVGSPDTGQSHRTAMSQICAAELGIPMDRIKFVSGDTQAMSQGSGTFASRFAVMAGNATALAAREIRQRAIAVAAEVLKVTPDAIEVRDGLFQMPGQPDRKVTLGELAKKARELGFELAVTHIFAPKDAVTWAGGGHAAVVQVDIETGVVKVERYVAVYDSGRLINPAVCEAQMEGGITLGLGQALWERIVFEQNGRQPTDNFKTYVIPRADQVPRFEVKEHPCLSPHNPEGFKGVGESGTIGTLATIAAAVEDALSPLNLQLNELPIRSEDLARMCEPLRSQPVFAGVAK